MERIKFLDSFIDNLSAKEIINHIDRFIDSGKPHQLVGINVAKLIRMHQDTNLAEVVNSCDIIFADGKAIIWASKFLGNPLKERVAGIDLMQEIVQHAANKDYRLYFLGARQEVVEKLAGIYKKSFPMINIVGWHNGYFKAQDEEKILLEEIRTLQPDILFVAMETPKKEYWIRDNLAYLGAPVCLGVGGSFDVIAGLKKRAPGWVQDIGLEWFFRFLNEPIRLWKRYLFSNAAFVWLIFMEKLGRN